MNIKLLILALLCGSFALAQEKFTLTNLDDFMDQAGNWEIVGYVIADPDIAVHTHQDEAQANLNKNQKRLQKKQLKQRNPITVTPGTGVLYNNYSFTKKDNLLTQWEHGDIKLEMEILIPKASNSGIYLQGRYELQLKDSYGVTNPNSSDFGGIHRNWETAPSKAFMGIAPNSSPYKAPGEWQTIKIHFQAPRFNDIGEKIANAKFVAVELNGVLIHSNVEVPLPTGGPISSDESATGPLMIQGDHGPMAFKNISYEFLEMNNLVEVQEIANNPNSKQDPRY
ncbi:3-keto-disaccharide hydrolase [Arenibacter certesii]|uniref:3-keto-alpha-glucoside-1,2-lyase/3-keto-2-hydroxy-glucal hydratase domain-containing protein n=1 Tax=Arenibacter certesii TaxID=228955 RepID=A0A918IU88_9FLAO|nr:DUF1080 domain-containing protein [Arenibacter certesii]GGW33066.1 hypothetical protein GCM10007383_17530 [Arenibacter certesii]